MKYRSLLEVKKADRLWDEMPLHEVAETTGIPYGTLQSWSQRGLISTDANHLTGPRVADWETVERVDELYDHMPLREIAKIVDVCHGTLRSWQNSGWISTEKDWHRICAGPKKREYSVERAVHLVHEKGLKQYEAAEQMGVSESTISRYLSDYRSNNTHD